MRKENEVMSKKEKLTERWTQGRISEAMLRVYVRKGIISKADFEESAGRSTKQKATARMSGCSGNGNYLSL